MVQVQATGTSTLSRDLRDGDDVVQPEPSIAQARIAGARLIWIITGHVGSRGGHDGLHLLQGVGIERRRHSR